MIFFDSGFGLSETQPKRVSSETRQTAEKVSIKKVYIYDVEVNRISAYIRVPICTAREESRRAALVSRQAILQDYFKTWDIRFSIGEKGRNK